VAGRAQSATGRSSVSAAPVALPMRRTSLARRFSPWLDIVRDLLATLHEFPRQVLLHELSCSFGTRASWAWGEADGGCGFEMTEPIFGWPSPECLELWRTAGATRHPLVAWYAATGDPAAMSAGRVPHGLVPGQSRDLVRDLLVHPELAQQLAVPCHLDGASYRAFVLTRPGTDFGDEDLALARRLQPLLALLHRQYAVLAATSPHTTVADLTQRELTVLHLLHEGRTAAAIGRQLGISPRTVHVHLTHVYRKLGVSDRLMAVRIYQDAGLPAAREELRAPPRGTGAYCLPAAASF
jgi:DNA-binding CsgD family transcriptional regulator